MKSFWPHITAPLTGQFVQLREMTEEHIPGLIEIASDKRIWEFYAFDGADKIRMANHLESAIIDKERGNVFPFVICLNSDQKIIGSTRFMDIQSNHKKLEIGTTWLQPQYWGSVINAECKLLLMQFCFEVAGAYRVQLKTDENNIRSRKAILKTGAQFEGILRNDMVRDNGTKRNSAYYSITDNEWPAAKTLLLDLVRRKSA